MNKRAKIMALKYTVYALILLMLYVLQTDPYFLNIAHIKPVLVLPFAICIAMFDSQLAGGLFGAFAGILCDTSSSVLFGFQSILYLIICTMVGLLVLHFMQPSVINSLIFVGSGLAVCLFLEYFFYYLMWGYENHSLVLLNHQLPVLVYTLVFTPLIFWMTRKLHRFFGKKIEE